MTDADILKKAGANQKRGKSAEGNGRGGSASSGMTGPNL